MLIQMIINEKQAKSLFKRLQDNRKVSKFTITEGEFLKWIATINYINCLDEDTFGIRGISLEKYNIAQQLSDMIVPSKVSFDIGIKFRNMKDGYDLGSIPENLLMNANDFNTMSDLICNAYKIVNDRAVNIAEARKPKLLSDCVKASSYEGEVRECESVFFPIRLDINVLNDRYLNTPEDEMFTLWGRNLILKLSL